MHLERAVPDTNIVVSAPINSFGAPGRTLDLVLDGAASVAHDDRLFAEWREVLYRENFGFDSGDVEAVLGFIENEDIRVQAQPPGAKLPNSDDLPFLEVAHAAQAILVTINLKHYPEAERKDVEVLEPTRFLRSRSPKSKTKDTGFSELTPNRNLSAQMF